MSLIPFDKHNKMVNRPFTNFIDDFFTNDWELANNAFKMDVREEILHYTVEAELPGINKKDIDISFDNGQLTISVSHVEESKTEKDKYIHKERRYSSAKRSVYLDGAKNDDISASLVDGLLTIRVPKDNENKNKNKIQIN